MLILEYICVWSKSIKTEPLNTLKNSNDVCMSEQLLFKKKENEKVLMSGCINLCFV